MPKETLESLVQKAVERLLIQKEEYECVKSMEAHALTDDVQLFAVWKKRISDEMTFATPAIWLKYKLLAYAGTPHEIRTWGDLKKHCSDPGDICAKRFAFLDEWLKKEGVNSEVFSDDESVLSIFNVEEVSTAIASNACLQEWQKHEFFMDEKRVAKWEG